MKILSFFIVVLLALVAIPIENDAAIGIPGLEEYNHSCTKIITDRQASASFDGKTVSVSYSEKSHYSFSGVETSCKWDWAQCTGYGGCKKS